MDLCGHYMKAPTFRALPSRPKSTPPSATGFREPPKRCLPYGLTRCLSLNTQLGRVSPYDYEALPPLSGLCQIWCVACRNRPTNHLISNLDPYHTFPVLWINLRTYRTTLLSHPDNNNQLISEFGHSPDELHNITL